MCARRSKPLAVLGVCSHQLNVQHLWLPRMSDEPHGKSVHRSSSNARVHDKRGWHRSNGKRSLVNEHPPFRSVASLLRREVNG